MTAFELRLLFSSLLREYRKTRFQILEQGRGFENAFPAALAAVCGSQREFRSTLRSCDPQTLIEVMKVADDTGVFAARVVVHYSALLDTTVVQEAIHVIQASSSSVRQRVFRGRKHHARHEDLSASVTKAFGGKGALIYALVNRPNEFTKLMSDPNVRQYTAQIVFWMRNFATRDLIDRATEILGRPPYPHRHTA